MMDIIWMTYRVDKSINNTVFIQLWTACFKVECRPLFIFVLLFPLSVVLYNKSFVTF
jgi:hypothetical protein